MELLSSKVRSALQRWEREGLLDADQLAELRAEVDRTETRSRRRFGQLVVGGTAGALILLGVVIFLGWSWPSLSPGARTAVLVLLALILHGLGSLAEGRPALRDPGYLLQTTGVAVLLVAFVHSERSWADGSAGAVVVGLLSLVPPLVLLPLSVSRNTLMPAVHGAFGYAFLFLFLDRALGLEAAPALWILDGVAGLAIVLLLARYARTPRDGSGEWVPGMLTTSLYAGLVLILFTGSEALDMGVEVLFPLDAWLTVIIGLTLWGIHRAPAHLRRDWFPRQLAWALFLAIPFLFITFDEALDAPGWLTAVGVAGMGASGLSYGLQEDFREVVLVSCLALVAAAWFLGVETGRALGAALALGFTGILLFWVSAVMGRGGGEAAPEESGG